MTERIHIDTKLDIFNLAVNEALFQDALKSPELIINAAKVEHCDYMGIQMFVSLLKTAHNQSHTIIVEEASQNFLKAVAILGLEDEFNFMDKHHG